MPPAHRIKPLREDYAKMQQMFFGQPREFDAIMDVLAQWELNFNRK
jgi:hypothetical protein